VVGALVVRGLDLGKTYHERVSGRATHSESGSRLDRECIGVGVGGGVGPGGRWSVRFAATGVLLVGIAAGPRVHRRGRGRRCWPGRPMVGQVRGDGRAACWDRGVRGGGVALAGGCRVVARVPVAGGLWVQLRGVRVDAGRACAGECSARAGVAPESARGGRGRSAGGRPGGRASAGRVDGALATASPARAAGGGDLGHACGGCAVHGAAESVGRRSCVAGSARGSRGGSRPVNSGIRGSTGRRASKRPR